MYLDTCDYEPDTGGPRVRTGEGNKERVTYLPAWAREALGAWLEMHSATPRTAALLLLANKAGRIQARRSSTQAVLDVLEGIAESAGVEAFAPHDIRRTFITRPLEGGADLHVVSQLAVHASVETTKLYYR